MFQMVPLGLVCAALVLLLTSALAFSSNAKLMATPNIPQTEMNALYELYNSTNGQNWDWKGTGAEWSFTPSANPCEDDWEGIQCHLPAPYTTNYVSAITLRAMNLRGLLLDSIGQFPYLALLDLSENLVSGSIPLSLSILTSLEQLNLNDNGFTGTLPAQLSNLAGLTALHVQDNYLWGPLPDAYGALTSLQTLYLQSNNITGTIPSALGSLPHLRELICDHNRLNGTIPASLGQLSTLRQLSLAHNAFSGTLPSALCALTQLTSLDVGYNRLVGAIPEDLGNLTLLTNLVLDNNRLSGSLPASLGNLAALQTFQAETNRLNGSLPASLSGLTSLSYFSVFENALTGAFPTGLCELPALGTIMLSSNLLTGTLSGCLGALPALTHLDLQNNPWSSTLPEAWGNLTTLAIFTLQQCGDLTGTIPASYAELQSLVVLALRETRISGSVPTFLLALPSLRVLELGITSVTGTLPDVVGSASQLQVLDFGENFIWGTIPPSYGSLTSLLYLNLGHSVLAGPLPASLGNLTSLRTLDVANCFLTGTIPPELGDLTSLQYLGLNNNHMNGSIPSALFDAMASLGTLSLNNNGFTGTVPSALSRLSQLNTLGLQDNQFRGRIDAWFDPTVQVFLQNIQLTSNHFSGTLPPELFQLPSLLGVVAISNCFSGTLPHTLCDAVGLQSLELDALHSSEDCQTKWLAGLDVYITKNSVAGTIPGCVFSLPKLKTLHLSSNAFTGSLPSDLTAMASTLTDLSLAHNKLTGSIPDAIQHRSWASLDLSYNRLTGTLSKALPLSASLSLRSNRLSGTIPSSLERATDVDILRSNMFSCQTDHSDLPENDPYVDIYQCGSDPANTPYFIWIACVTAVAGLMSAAYAYSTRIDAKDWVHQKVSVLRNWLTVSDPDQGAKSHLSYVSSVFCAYGHIGAQLALYCVLVLAPLYGILTAYYGTHRYEYIWAVSAVLKEGTVPLSVQFTLYFLLLALYVMAYLRYTGTLADPPPPPQGDIHPGPTTLLLPTRWSAYVSHLRCAVYVLFNFAVVGVVNVYYVFLKVNSPPSFQLTISAFKVVWNGYCSPRLSRHLLRPRTQHSLLELFVSLVNTVAIPVLATLFISPDCFYEAFVPPTDDYVSFAFEVCVAQGPSGCLVSVETRGIIAFQPPFQYNYQCAYAFAEYYVPAFIYVCVFNTFGTPLVERLLSLLHHRAVPGTWWFAVVDTVTPRIHKATTEPALPNQRCDPLRPYFDATQFTIAQLTNLCLLLTFGAVFPPLAAAIAVTMVCTVYEARLKVGRFLSVAAQRGHSGYDAVIEQECMGVAERPMLLRSMWMVFACAAVFLALFLYDTLGAQDAFHGAYWVLYTFPAVTIAIYAAYLAVRRVWPGLVPSGVAAGPTKASAADPLESAGTAVRPASTTVMKAATAAIGLDELTMDANAMTFNALNDQL